MYDRAMEAEFTKFKGLYFQNNLVPITSNSTNMNLIGIKHNIVNFITFIDGSLNYDRYHPCGAEDWASQYPVKRRAGRNSNRIQLQHLSLAVKQGHNATTNILMYHDQGSKSFYDAL